MTTGWRPAASRSSVLPRRPVLVLAVERDTERVGTIVGRDRELAEVSRALADARGGQGRLLLVSGPAGIGKTTLALAAAADAERLGMTVTKGWAVDDPGAPV